MSQNRKDQPQNSRDALLLELWRKFSDNKRTPQLPSSITVGSVTLVAGFARVSGSHGKAAHNAAHIFLFKQTVGITGTPFLSGWQKGNYFDITSTNAADTSVISYLIVAT